MNLRHSTQATAFQSNARCTVPIKFEVLEAGYVVHVTFTYPWTAEDMQPIFDQDQRYRDQIQKEAPGRKVHLFVTFQGVKNVPPGALRARQSPSLHHVTSGYVVVVGTTSLLRTLADAVFKLAHFDKARNFETDAEALAFLRQVIAQDSPAAV